MFFKTYADASGCLLCLFELVKIETKKEENSCQTELVYVELSLKQTS